MIAAPAQESGRGGLALSDREFQWIRDFLYERAGLYFHDSKKLLLEARLRKRLSEVRLGTVAEYLALLRGHSAAPQELLHLLDAVTIHETFFFRHPPQIEAFRRHVLPEALRRQEGGGDRLLRIWSAACSSGEEPFTLAMVALEALGANAALSRIRILGTDVARSVLEKAQHGVYARYSFRGTPAYFIQKYFEPVGPDAFRLKDEPRRLVELRLLNFADDRRMRAMHGFHVIFCRNALIYFDRPMKQRFVAHFADALEPGGFFFAGHAESLHGVTGAFKIFHFPGALAYQKPAPGSNGSCHP
jgi:chemotaxis protein methyltransferase CheR